MPKYTHKPHVVHNRIEEARKQCNLRRYDLCHFCHVSESLVGKWAKQKIQPGPGLQRKLAYLLDKEMHELFDYIDPTTGKPPSQTWMDNLYSKDPIDDDY